MRRISETGHAPHRGLRVAEATPSCGRPQGLPGGSRHARAGGRCAGLPVLPRSTPPAAARLVSALCVAARRDGARPCVRLSAALRSHRQDRVLAPRLLPAAPAARAGDPRELLEQLLERRVPAGGASLGTAGCSLALGGPVSSQGLSCARWTDPQLPRSPACASYRSAIDDPGEAARSRGSLGRLVPRLRDDSRGPRPSRCPSARDVPLRPRLRRSPVAFSRCLRARRPSGAIGDSGHTLVRHRALLRCEAQGAA